MSRPVQIQIGPTPVDLVAALTAKCQQLQAVIDGMEAWALGEEEGGGCRDCHDKLAALKREHLGGSHADPR